MRAPSRPDMPLLLRLYHYGLAALEPAAAAILMARRRKGKEDPERMRERRGIAGARAARRGHLAWLHGAQYRRDPWRSCR